MFYIAWNLPLKIVRDPLAKDRPFPLTPLEVQWIEFVD